ncbi:saccharopine dehydrogenase NADP-binding domain-containing protein [Actinosynnema pretiosum subsp. pretiosum]|uniref:Saccharopine dehydrogenase n=2 Tax=Actinosynnema TaxID=40566 RepID=C6WAW5_ACTMD|nr:saccharopine dehydrogenase family protein [Actinosynnema mirum]ACU37434.1 Saccharopine dehydrogenase [Actinosynnema mirum DSM 43827]AXX30906.1 saccharopine dehydrogenase [Actinosynnema pretiosum subsp. pretiosum]QUF04992.1 saccharopine dehydrogenase NADP-binding domain-containing protein [Actinosynnema pretiosum subsp. pretiosum]
MPEHATPASGRVHWIGVGLSTGDGLRQLARAAREVLVWGRTTARADQRVAELGLTGEVRTRAYSTEALAAEVGPGDVVVSMLPAPEHPAVLRVCLDNGAHFASSSYLSPEVAELAADAASRGLVVLTEAGLDPGSDHLLAHDLLDRAAAELGADTPASITFTSYCGGLPAVPNEFRYRFSWAPRSVLTALLGRARYVEGGVERVAERPWEAVRPHVLGGEEFEVYPNRDSVPYVRAYGVPDAWRPEVFIRGTIRNSGWSAAWEPVFAELRAADDARLTALANELAERYPTTPADRDRVVLAVALEVRADDGREWRGEHVLDVVGDDTDSAMARTVSTTLARGVLDVLEGRTAAGTHTATTDPEAARRWLGYLAEHGVRFTSR